MTATRRRYVPNIFWAKPEDYKPATQSIVHAPGQASAIWLPVVAGRRNSPETKKAPPVLPGGAFFMCVRMVERNGIEPLTSTMPS